MRARRGGRTSRAGRRGTTCAPWRRSGRPWPSCSLSAPPEPCRAPRLEGHAVVGRDLAAACGVGAAVEQVDGAVEVPGDDVAAGRGLGDREVAELVEV